MLEEAAQLIRDLGTGETISHRGTHYTVDTARLYTLPDSPPPIYLSAFGDKALDLACRVGDGLMTTMPDGEAVRKFKAAKGPQAVTQAGFKCGWAPTKDEAIDHAHRLWPNAGVPGELSQVLPSPQHFEQASGLVTRQMTADSTAFGNDQADHIAAYQPFLETDSTRSTLPTWARTMRK